MTARYGPGIRPRGAPIGDLQRHHGSAEASSGAFDLGAAVSGLALATPSRLVAATELGIVSLRLPNSS